MRSRHLMIPSLLLVASFVGSGTVSAQPDEVCLLSSTPPVFQPGIEDRLHALPHGAVSGHSGFHGQGLYGLEHLYLVHLAVFMGAPDSHPHNFQVVLEVDLDDPEAQAQYRSDRSNDPTLLYTAEPVPFDQTALVVGYSGRPALDRLAASSIVRGHFEQGGVPILEDVNFDIGRVVYFREFFLGGEKLADQNYLIFGRGGESFGAHLLSAPPDFDQLLSLEVQVAGSEGAEEAPEVAAEVAEALAGGIYLRLPGRLNQESSRLQPDRGLACSLSHPSSPEPIAVTVRVLDEIYCEAGEFSQLVLGSFNQPRRCALP